MAPEYTGRGEGRRTMDLLWGRAPTPSRGPKPGLDLGTIVATAIRIADRDGIDAVSMRRVAGELGVGAMSLYTYVPGKAELLELMVDRVIGSVHGTSAAGPGWRAALEAHARELWTMYERHPWILQVSTSRATMGPNELDAYERFLSTVADIGLPAREAVAIAGALQMYVFGAARFVAEARRAEEATGKSELEWWGEHEPVLDEVMSAERFPSLTRLGQEGGFDVPPDAPDYIVTFALDDFEFGLQRLLDGVEAHVARVRRSGARPPRQPRGRRDGSPARRG